MLNRAMKASRHEVLEKWQAFLHELLITVDDRLLLSQISIDSSLFFFLFFLFQAIIYNTNSREEEKRYISRLTHHLKSLLHKGAKLSVCDNLSSPTYISLIPVSKQLPDNVFGTIFESRQALEVLYVIMVFFSLFYSNHF